ncbi:MAG: glycosyltransferase, partial [Candidatus Omnitrophota bacterium]
IVAHAVEHHRGDNFDANAFIEANLVRDADTLHEAIDLEDIILVGIDQLGTPFFNPQLTLERRREALFAKGKSMKGAPDGDCLQILIDNITKGLDPEYYVTESGKAYIAQRDLLTSHIDQIMSYAQKYAQAHMDEVRSVVDWAIAMYAEYTAKRDSGQFGASGDSTDQPDAKTSSAAEEISRSYEEIKADFIERLKSEIADKIKALIPKSFLSDKDLWVSAVDISGVYDGAISDTFDFLSRNWIHGECIRDAAIVGFGGLGRQMMYGNSSDIDIILLVPESTDEAIVRQIKGELNEILLSVTPNGASGHDRLDMHDLSKISEVAKAIEQTRLNPLDISELVHTRHLAGNTALSQELHERVTGYLDSFYDYNANIAFFHLMSGAHRAAARSGIVNMKTMRMGFIDFTFLYELARFHARFEPVGIIDNALRILRDEGYFTDEETARLLKVLNILVYVRLVTGKKILNQKEWEEALAPVMPANEFERLRENSYEIVRSVEDRALRPFLGYDAHPVGPLYTHEEVKTGFLADFFVLWNTPDTGYIEDRFKNALEEAGGDIENIGWFYLMAFGANRNTPPYILARLASIRNFRLREVEAVTSINPSTPINTLLNLIQDDSARAINRERAAATIEKMRSEARAKDPDLVLTYHGSISEAKNLGLFIQAAARLNKHYRANKKSFLAEIYGGAPVPRLYEKRLAELAKEVGLEGVVAFRGSYDLSNLRAIYELYPLDKRVCLFPSENEAFGFSMLEAMRLGVPVVAPNSGAAPEVMSDMGQGISSGIMISVAGLNDAEKVDKYVEAVLSVQENRTAQGYDTNAVSLSQRFTVDRMAAKYYEEFYKLRRSAHARKEGFTLHYLSPGYFPYVPEGVNEWSQNLILGLDNISASSDTGPCRISVTSLRGDNQEPTKD